MEDITPAFVEDLKQAILDAINTAREDGNAGGRFTSGLMPIEEREPYRRAATDAQARLWTLFWSWFLDVVPPTI